MNRSIRGILLFWHAAIMFAVLGGAGIALWTIHRQAVYGEVDAQLLAHARTVAAAIEFEEEGFELELAPAFFRDAERDSPYFIVWANPGEILARSSKAPDRPFPDDTGLSIPDGAREQSVPGPAGTRVLVGRRTHPIREELRRFRNVLATISLAAFFAALAGGRLLVRRVLRPIDRMSGAASSISASNLSRRINVGRTETELGRLAATLNEAFDRLQQAFERQSRFTADASHELRTPLSILIANIEVALREEVPLPQRETLETCLRAARRMKGMVDGLLTLARADAGEAELAREPVDLKSVVSEAVSMLHPMAAEHRVTIHLTADPVRLTGDRQRLHEVALNLISNAIQYNQEGGRVDVSLRREAEAAVLTVQDTGIGISEGDLPHVFERFYRADRARSRSHGGCGLGLAITKWIVERHGGTITVDSREGEGSTFAIHLPVAPQPGFPTKIIGPGPKTGEQADS